MKYVPLDNILQKKGLKCQIGKTVPTNFFKSRVHELGSRLGCGTHNEKEVEISRQNFVQYHDLAAFFLSGQWWCCLFLFGKAPPYLTYVWHILCARGGFPLHVLDIVPYYDLSGVAMVRVQNV